MRTVCHNQLSFANLDSQAVVAKFTAEPMISDGGSLLLCEIDQAMGLATSMSQVLCDPRDPAKIRHAQEELIEEILPAPDETS